MDKTLYKITLDEYPDQFALLKLTAEQASTIAKFIDFLNSEKADFADLPLLLFTSFSEDNIIDLDEWR